MLQLNFWSLPVLIVGTEPFASEDLIFWKCEKACEPPFGTVRSDHQARSRTSLSVLFNEKAKTRLVLFTLSSLWNITTCVSCSGWNRSRGSESASTWLSRSSCTITQRIQLEAEFVDEHVREDDESSRQRLCLGFARLTMKSIEPILASFLTTSPDVQRVLNHRICDKKHKHGSLFDLSSESSLQFPQSLCQTLAKQLLVKDSWHSVYGHSGTFASW